MPARPVRSWSNSIDSEKFNFPSGFSARRVSRPEKEKKEKMMLKASEKRNERLKYTKGLPGKSIIHPSKQAAEADNDLPKQLPWEAHRMPLSGLDVYIFGLGTFLIVSHFHIFHSRPEEKNVWRKRRRRRQGSEFSSLLMSSFLTFQEKESKERERKWENL